MSERSCVLCNHSTDDPLQLGEKLTFEDTTAHLYCLLLTSNLVQRGEDDEGLYGFLPKDIKTEVSRTKKLFCHYCHQKGATIGCCIRACRYSFHLPCALQHDCRLEFSKTFRSFCDEHHNLKPPKNAHKPTDLCTICYDEMGQFNVIRSIALPCCNKNAWCHKFCLQKYAQTSGYFLTCPLCKDSDTFRDWITERGVFIPDRDAKWEIDETGPNGSFYGYAQHDARPTSCTAKVCKCPKGRNYQVDIENHRNSMEYCDYCGSVAVHFRCFDGDKFCCDECKAVVIRTEALAAISKPANGVASSSSGDFTVVDNDANLSEKYRMIASKFNIRDCSVPLARLKAKDFDSTPELNYQKCVELRLIKAEKPKQSATNITKRANASSDENEIRPVIRKTDGKIDAYFVRVLDSDSDIEIAPVKVGQSPKLHAFSSSSDSDSNIKVVNNASGAKSLTVQQTKPKPTTTTNRLIERTDSSSGDEPNRPSVIIRNFFQKISPEDLLTGKENEKPAKTVAVVRPFSMPSETSFGQQNNNIKTDFSGPGEALYPSSSGTSDDSPNKSTITQRYDYMKNVPKKEEPSVGILSFVSIKTTTTTTTTSTSKISTIPHESSTDDHAKRTPNKRKHRSVRSYFGHSSSSDDEVEEPKPKRKSPKQSKRNSPAAHGERQPNQSTISNFFQRKLNQGI